MHEASLGTKLLLNGAQKRDNVVMCLLLDLLHAFGIIARLAYLLERLLWNHAFAHPAFADEQFYLQPRISFMLRRPDGDHLRQGISFNHCVVQSLYNRVMPHPY